MKTISIKIKLILLVILPIIILTAVLTGLAIYQTYQLGRQEVETARGSMRASKETELKNYVDTAVSAIKPLYEKAAADDKAAQEQARVILRQLGYGKDGYFFAYLPDGTNLVLRPKPELEGKNLSSLKDTNGVFYVREMIEQAKRGGGYVEYIFDKPSKKKAVPKLSYAAGLEKWQWMIGTGFYIDDIDDAVSQIEQKVDHQLRQTIMLSGLGVLLVAGLTPVSYTHLTLPTNREV